MKKIWTQKIIGLCLMIGIITSCNLLPDTNDDCEDGKWSSIKEPTIYLKLSLEWDTVGSDGMVSYISYVANSATFSGTITKVYCGGKVSSSFSFSPTFYPGEMSYEEMENGFYLPQPYQFKFEHDEDYVHVIARIQYHFEKLSPVNYESFEISQRFYYKDLQYDYNLNSNYIRIHIDKEMPYVIVVE
jgi:hypothetical protein